MRLDKGGVTTDPLLRPLVTLPTTSIAQSPPDEDDSGRRDGRTASWKELSGRSLHRGIWDWLRGVPLDRTRGDGDSGATLTSESPFGSPGSPGLQVVSWLAEEPAGEPRRGVVSLSEERLERLASEQGRLLPLIASQLVRTYPSPTRWWSTNNNPLVRARPRSHHLA